MENIDPASHAIKRQGPPPEPQPPLGGNLFDNLSSWLDTPELAYASWLNGKEHLRESSKRVYLSMFGRFCQYLNSKGIRLNAVEEGDIKNFLDSTNPNLPESRLHRSNTGRQRKQYLRLIERVFAHLDSIRLSTANPGRQADRKKHGDGNDNATRFLTSAESDSLIRLVQSRLVELREEEKSIDRWMEYRDLALIGVLIGGGLKVSHVGALTLNCIDRIEQRIDLSKPGHAHRARLLPFAVPLLEAWLVVQAQCHERPLPPTHKVFEADRTLGFGRNCKKATLAASSVHRRVAKLLLQAGISGERASAQTLRNTYAALLIDGGASDENLVDFLGLKASVTAARLRTAYARSRQPQTSVESIKAEIAAATPSSND